MPWVGVSLLVGVALLVATGVIATFHESGTVALLPAFSGQPSLGGVAFIVRRNLLVLALHALVCVAGYLAMRGVPSVADAYEGPIRTLHRAATPIALVFVSLATLGSLTVQALALGEFAASIAAAYNLTPQHLLILILPHALPELTALFLPLGAWMVIARRNEWGDLLAASIITTALAVPVLVMAAIIEVYVSPLLVLAA